MSSDTTSETAIFERIVFPDEPGMNEAAARTILAMGFNPADRLRMQVLADKAKAGSLSPDEEIEIENYERVGHHLGILQSKARLALRSMDSPDT